MTISVTLVTYNSRRYVRRCLEALLAQKGVPFDVTVVDNASEDGTANLLAAFERRVRVIYNDRNVGFAAAQNQAIAATSGDWVLALNPDVLMSNGFLRRLADAAEIDPGAGAVCGKLLSIGPDFEPPAAAYIDSTGLFFTPSMRHFDRGWGTPDDGRFDVVEYVFGASAAAAMYRREMIEDISHEDGFFDPDFFTYREDADVAWRAQLFGWRCIYTPHAVAYHVRRLTPGSRSAAPALVNMHCVKNRFLLRIKNATLGLYLRCWLPATARDLLVLGACLLYEPASLPAFWRLAACLPRALGKRRQIMRRRKLDDEALARWFSAQPVTEPVPHTAPRSEPRLLAALAAAGKAPAK
jgi:GT2 family glycosyltransferase